jgi:hypothetical protein
MSRRPCALCSAPATCTGRFSKPEPAPSGNSLLLALFDACAVKHQNGELSVHGQLTKIKTLRRN